jgi:hypothetical protein
VKREREKEGERKENLRILAYMNCILAVISLVFLPEDERRKKKNYGQEQA